MTDTLTDRQQNILDFISEQIQDAGYPPTIREIGKKFSISIGAVQGHIEALERKGVLKKAKDHARGLIIAARREVAGKIGLPILGRVVAGVPLEAISNVEDYLSVDESIAKQANFVLRVKGDSMFPEFREGDLVLVKNTEAANNGDVVIAYLEDEAEATVKRLRRKGKDIFLEAANPKYLPIRDRSFTVIGRVTSLIRTFF